MEVATKGGETTLGTARGAPPARRWLGVALFALAVAVFSSVVWQTALRQALDQVGSRGEADLALASDRLSGQLQRYRELAVLLGVHPQLVALTEGRGDAAAASALLLRTLDRTATLDLALVDPEGRVLASAVGGPAGGARGTPYLERALDGALGFSHTVAPDTGQRAFVHAAPVFSKSDGRVAGAIIVTVDVEDVEADWRGSRPAVFFTDDQGVVFVSNRSELVLRRHGGVEASGDTGLPPFPDRSTREVGGHQIWRLEAGPYLPEEAIHIVRDLPVIGLTGEALIDTRPARNIAALQAAAAAALCLAFGALLFWATERRRTLARANARLEARVAERTAMLERSNAALRREVAEREEAEAALTRAQADLVQAGKLSALGQMGAGISHELNQPLMAIQSFAENARQFIDRGKPEVAGQNLGRIADLARRMGRIIKNFRAFARQEDEPLSRVDAGAVVTSALEITEDRIARAEVEVLFVPPTAPVWVRAGEVRLTQVVVNLVSNACDAMVAAEVSGARLLRIDLVPGDPVRLTVQDSGPGIAQPDRIFDPFYSTKAVGSSEGMGLGLSISYGLVQSFGGAIRGQNAPEGGAVFTVELAPWQDTGAQTKLEAAQ